MRVPQYSDIKNHYVSLLTVGSAEKLKKFHLHLFLKFQSHSITKMGKKLVVKRAFFEKIGLDTLFKSFKLLVGKNAHVADVADHSVKYRQLIVFKIRIKIKKITS